MHNAMPVKGSSQAPMFKAMQDAVEDSREIALAEIKELKRDLTTLERILSGRKKSVDDFSLIDVAHGAFEIYRTATVVLENERLMSEMEEAMESSLAVDFLVAHGATLLKEPAGWHWISPKGVMRFLGEEEAPVEAVKKLKRYLPKTPKKNVAPVEESPKAES